MVEKDISRGSYLTAPHVQSSSKHLLTDQPADNENAEQQIPFFFHLLVILAGFLFHSDAISLKNCRNLVTPPHSEIQLKSVSMSLLGVQHQKYDFRSFVSFGSQRNNVNIRPELL